MKKKICNLWIDGKSVDVTYEIYKTYYRELEHERYLEKRSARSEWSYEEMQESGISFEYRSGLASESAESQVIRNETEYTVRRKVSQLDIDDQILVRLYFFENAKCEEIGRILKVSQPTVCRRKEKILKKLGDMLADEV